MPKIVIPSAVMPHPAHSVRAANVVLEQLLRSLATVPGLKTSFLPVFVGMDAKIDSSASVALSDLEEIGLTIEEPLILPAPEPKQTSRLRRLVDHSLERFQPLVASQGLAQKVVKTLNADWLMSVWSESLTALFSNVSARKFAYYGNPDPKNFRARTALLRRNNSDKMLAFRNWLSARQLESAHIKMMRSWDIVGNVAALDAEYYRRKGHPRSIYIQNVWIDRFGWPEVARRRAAADAARAPNAPVQIVANLGKLAGTANTYGLLFLANELYPELRRAFGTKPFELHVYGSGEAHPLVRDALRQKEIILRGFVDDIDAELLEKPIFLCVNNASAYNVGHTRYLHAFTLGCCVIASAKTALAMPEIQHGVNALLGANARDIADQIKVAAENPDLRRRLGEAGYETFVRFFRAPVVARKIADEIRV